MRKIELTEEQYNRLQENLVESTILAEQSKNEIMDIQGRLNQCFNAGLTVDGICGPKTKNAIESNLGIKTYQV
jgi:hypothetical protein